jgi:hypothetical protein
MDILGSKIPSAGETVVTVTKVHRLGRHRARKVGCSRDIETRAKCTDHSGCGNPGFAQGDADLEAPGLESFAASVSASDGAKAVGTGLFG